MESGKIKLSIDSDLNQVQHVGEAVRSFCKHVEFVDAKPSSVELAVVEAVNNSIEHAYRSKTGNTVDVAFEYSSDCLSIKIRDYGVPMPSKLVCSLANEPDMPNKVYATDELPESGWGLHLLKSVCDDVSYHSRSNCNTLNLSFKLNPATA